MLEPATLSFFTAEGTYAALNDEDHPKFDGGQTLYRRRWCYLVAEHGARPENGRYGAVLWPAVQDEAAATGGWQIRAETSHHRIDLPCGRGAEVRFPGDWRQKAGLSYAGAEPFKWGSIAQWKPGADAGHAELTVVSPQRYPRATSTATELFLPDGFVIENVSLMSMTGGLFPEHLISIDADGKPIGMTVKKV